MFGGFTGTEKQCRCFSFSFVFLVINWNYDLYWIDRLTGCWMLRAECRRSCRAGSWSLRALRLKRLRAPRTHICNIELISERDVVNSRSRSLYVIVRPSVCLSVTFVHPIQAIKIFGNVFTPFVTTAIYWHPGKILRSSQWNPSVGGVKH